MRFIQTDSGIKYKVPDINDPISLVTSCEECGMPINYNPTDENRWNAIRIHDNFHKTIGDLITATVKHELSKQKPSV